MATIKECSNCGSIYELSYVKVGMIDKDSIDCEVCGNELFSWKSSKIWSDKLIERHENHKSKFDTDGFTDEGGK
jgi:hypothetical protein